MTGPSSCVLSVHITVYFADVLGFLCIVDNSQLSMLEAKCVAYIFPGHACFC